MMPGAGKRSRDNVAATDYSSEKFWWWKKAREELILVLLKKHFNTPTPRVLDVGCGDGRIAKIVMETYNAKLEGIEMNPSMANVARINGVACVAYKIEERKQKNEYDLILLLDVLEHIEKDDDALRKIVNQLKPRGNLLITVPLIKALWSPQDIEVGHKRRYEKDEIRKLLRKQGLEIISDGCWNFILTAPVAMQKIIWRYNGNKKWANNQNSVLGKMLYRILKLENGLIKNGVTLPIGISYFAICRKA
ncbi:MAG: class I SAM-dependent methyltransferase [Desulfobulbaceae bacterium]|nr:class I SAM-dependent methyltransferase [Desulfobulbaceae bacterium]